MSLILASFRSAFSGALSGSPGLGWRSLPSLSERAASFLSASTSAFGSDSNVEPFHRAHRQLHTPSSPPAAAATPQVSPLQSALADTPSDLPKPIYDLTPRELESVLIERPLWAEARWRRAPTTAKKMRIPVNLVRRMHVSDALIQLQLVEKKAAKMLAMVIWRARMNAVHNHGMDPDKLVCVQVSASVGPDREFEIDYKSRGRHGIIRKGRSHLYVRVQEVEGARPFTEVRLPYLWRERMERERRAAGRAAELAAEA